MWHGIKCNDTFALHSGTTNIAFHGCACIGCKLTPRRVLMVWAQEMDNVQESCAVYRRLSNVFEVKRFIENCPMLLN